MAHHHEMAGHYASHLPLLAGPGVLTSVVLVHTLGHLVVAGLVALLFLRKAWLVGSETGLVQHRFRVGLALVATGVILLFM